MKIKTVFALLWICFLMPPSFAQEVPVKVATYDQLISEIRRVRTATEERIEAAVDAEKVREAWEIGKLVHEHILLNNRAQYGQQVIERLSEDLGMSRTELGYMVEFAKAYPISPKLGKLSWSHYRLLLSVNDREKREALATQAEKEKWSSTKLREEIKKRKHAVNLDSPSELAAITPGPLYTYTITRLHDRLKIDLGFGVYRDLSEKDAKKFKEGDIATLEKGKLKKAEKAPLYTYAAMVTGVVDGDTFHALIDLGFETTLAERVRLRRIDAPEILSAEGKEAKLYLEKILSRDHGRVILQSHDLDQHGRPIADVWCQGKSVDQELLDHGLAVKIHE